MNTMLNALVSAQLVDSKVLSKKEFEDRLPEIRRSVLLIRANRAERVSQQFSVENMQKKVNTDPAILARVQRTLVEKTRKGLI
jgi:hypothetical protein